MQYSLAKIAEIVNGKVLGDSSVIIEEVFIDSRKKSNPTSSLFCAITGHQHDGHDYIEALIASGHRNFLVDQKPRNYNDKAQYVVVSDVLESLQRFAKHHRHTFNFPIVGISGSNGKTIVKEWCYQMLYKTYNVSRNPKSYNSQVGVPLSVLLLNPLTQIGLFEAGISEVGEMDKLRAIIDPSIGIFTNIGDAHSAGFTNETEKIYEKLNLFKGCEVLLYRREENLLTDIIDRYVEKHGITPVTWSDSLRASAKVVDRVTLDSSTKVTLQYGNKKLTALLPFTDDASFENAMHVWLLGLHLELDSNLITEALRYLTPIEMRLNQKAGLQDCQIISDFYNSDLTSIEIALDWANQRHTHLSKTIILSDVEQSSLSDRDLFTTIHNLLQKHQYSKLIGIGQRISDNQFLFDLPEQAFYSSTASFLKETDLSTFSNEAILLKGGRSFQFEKIEKQLQLKVHNTVLEIDLNALQQNLNYFKSLVNPTTKIMVMVKAFSYGSGGDEIAHFLQYNNVDYLGVAYADEGVALRKQGIKLPIMVMNSDEDSYDVMLDNDLEPELYNFRSLDMFIKAVKRKAIDTAKAHIEVNTGMNRLGFKVDDLDEIVLRLEDAPGIKVQSVFSHFAASENKAHDPLSISQIASLNSFHVRFKTATGYNPLKHIANSAGAIRFKEGQMDMIRLGVGLYGFHPVEENAKSIVAISTLKSFVSQIRTVKAGEGIGYGNIEVANHDRKIAVVAIGYADGLSRLLSQGNGWFSIQNKTARIVGNICMDMTMCDVTDINCAEGDEVIVFGKSPSIVEIAKNIGTIPYEIMTSVSQRVKRVYSEA
ncbi:MAG: alanine racemase [Bacteroidia bacterium]